jgi:hypothetical protein
VKRELRHALAAVRSDAESFGEHEVAELIGAHFDAVQSLDYLSLAALEALAQALASPGLQGEHLASRLADLQLGRSIDAGIGEAFAALPAGEGAPAAPTRQARPEPAFSSTAPTPVVTPAIRADARMATSSAPPNAASAPPAPPPVNTTPSSFPSPTPAPRAIPSGPRSRTPVGAQHISTPRDTMAVLDQGIDSLSAIAAQPMSDPVDIAEQPLVPIDALLYRGRAAIERAIELREVIKRGGGSANDETMAELFDLLDLALAE